MYTVYVLYNFKDKNFYTGYTTNITRRINEHIRGKVTSTHKRNKILIFYEVFLDSRDARRREKYFKTTKGKRTLRLMLKYTLVKQTLSSSG